MDMIFLLKIGTTIIFTWLAILELEQLEEEEAELEELELEELELEELEPKEVEQSVINNKIGLGLGLGLVGHLAIVSPVSLRTFWTYSF